MRKVGFALVGGAGRDGRRNSISSTASRGGEGCHRVKPRTYVGRCCREKKWIPMDSNGRKWSSRRGDPWPPTNRPFRHPSVAFLKNWAPTSRFFLGSGGRRVESFGKDILNKTPPHSSLIAATDSRGRQLSPLDKKQGECMTLASGCSFR